MDSDSAIPEPAAAAQKESIMRYLIPVIFPMLIVPVLVAQPSKPEGTWREREDDPGRLYCDKPVKGVWSYVTESWCDTKDDGSFGEWRKDAPVVIPPAKNPELIMRLKTGDMKNIFGVIVPKLHDRPKYYMGGAEVDRATILDVLKGKIPDMRHHRRITIIGSAEERKAAKEIIGTPDWAVVNEYSPDDWHVKDSGFVLTGHPTVYCTDPEGGVLHRQDDLQDLAGALRKADPKYDPKEDPDLRVKPHVPVAPDFFSLTWWIWLLIGGGAGLTAPPLFRVMYGLVKRQLQAPTRDEWEALKRQLVEAQKKGSIST